jgi:hypothetical protein
VRQPTESGNNNPTTVGAIFVDSDSPGAHIFIDEKYTNQVTPDTLHALYTGEHVLNVIKDGYISDPGSLDVTVEAGVKKTAFFHLTEIVNPGYIIVSSSPDQSMIRNNGNFTGKFTPDTIIVPSGNHTITLEKNSFEKYEFSALDISAGDTAKLYVTLDVQKSVLVESFANTSCLPCTTTTRLIEELKTNVGEEEIVIVEYFGNWPNPADIFYTHNPAGNQARIDFYDIFLLPGVYISGEVSDPLDAEKMSEDYTRHFTSLKSNITLSISTQVSDSLHVSVDIIPDNDLSVIDPRLFVLITENGIRLESPPGANGLNKFQNVFRKFLSSSTGDQIIFTNEKDQKKYSTSFSSDWNRNSLQIIAFVQDLQSGVVYHVAKL